MEKTDRATLNVDEAAILLGIGRAAAYQAVHRGEIPSIRVGARLLIPRQALERMLDGEPQAEPAGAGVEGA